MFMTKVYNITSHIGIMPCPQGGALLSSEIRQLREQGFNSLVCLLTRGELALLDLEKEEEECNENGIRFIYFPIEDFSIPQDMTSATKLVDMLSEEMRAGRKVIIHCRGGIGRSSLVAGALLVRQGYSLGNALMELQNCRGCKVPETPGQEAWLKGFEVAERARITL